jgi:hypothetical protein
MKYGITTLSNMKKDRITVNFGAGNLVIDNEISKLTGLPTVRIREISSYCPIGRRDYYTDTTDAPPITIHSDKPESYDALIEKLQFAKQQLLEIQKVEEPAPETLTPCQQYVLKLMEETLKNDLLEQDHEIISLLCKHYSGSTEELLTIWMQNNQVLA